MNPQGDGLRLSIGRTDDGIAIELDGELDVETATRLAEELARVAADVEIDMSRVTFCDSSGLHALLDARRSASASGHRLSVTQPSASVARLLALTGTADLLISQAGGRPPTTHAT